MSDTSEERNRRSRTGAISLCGIIAIAAAGYIVGINDGVPREDQTLVTDSLLANHAAPNAAVSGDAVAGVIPATSYVEMRRTETGPTSHWKPTLGQIPQPEFDLFADIKPSESDKQQSTLTRATRRSFNGAPPVIPHIVENTTDSACYACHGKGMRIDDRIANRMSHQFLANCTQCHAPPPPKPFADVDADVASSFVGLPAPMKGERAFPGAPPTIPHSTWMRSECLACHGNAAGWAGLQSTHPWRASCQQCHAPSATLEQGVPSDVGFLPPPSVIQE